MQLVLFNPYGGPYQVLPFRARVDLGAVAIKGCSAFPKARPSDCLVSYPGHWLGGESYPSAEKQSVYSTDPADWASLDFSMSYEYILTQALCHQ